MKLLKNNMNKILNLVNSIFILGVFLLGLSNQVQAEIIWQENFDNQADWQLVQPSSANITSAAWHGEASIPAGFHSWYVQGTPYATAGNSPLQINSTNSRGTGKAATFWNDSGDTNCDSGGSWCSDQLLGAQLPDSQEVYAQYWIKFQDGWQWETGHSAYEKFFRISHYNSAAGSPFSFGPGSDNTQRPIVIVDFAQYDLGGGNGSANTSQISSYRYGNVYFPDQATPSHVRHTNAYFEGGNYGGTGLAFDAPGQPGDGQWHKFIYHLKMNSAVGVADGIYEVFYDDVLLDSQTDLAFLDQGADAGYEWNYFQIGGNSYNHYAPMADEAQQWYAIDDICIATTQADLANCFSASPTTIRADVDGQAGITFTDALLTLRSSVGLAMSGTNWKDSTTTGDVNCDEISNSTDALLILRDSQGFDMSETGWCVN